MFSLHSFFFLFSPTSEFVPATVFLVAIFLALRLCVSMTQMTILADFFPHQCTVWQWTDTTWGDLQAGLVTAPEANLPVPSGACLSFTCRWLNGTCLPLPPPSPTHTHTHTLLWASANSVQCSAQLKLIRTLGNDRVNTRSLFLMIFSITRDFPLSHACLFFQIARKDINNVILPSK